MLLDVKDAENKKQLTIKRRIKMKRLLCFIFGHKIDLFFLDNMEIFKCRRCDHERIRMRLRSRVKRCE